MPYRDAFAADNPDNGPDGREDLTYSFAHKNSFVAMVDVYHNVLPFPLGSPGPSGNFVEQDWLDAELAPYTSANQAGMHDTHVFVLTHEPMYPRRGGREPGLTDEDREVFLDSLEAAGARFYMDGHDHQHSRSTIRYNAASGEVPLQQVIAAPAGEKYYGHNPEGEPGNVEVVRQGRRPGYYVYTVDGAHLFGELWSTPELDKDGPATFDWKVTERFGYSLNGPQYFVGVGDDYDGLTATITPDTAYVGTTARLLGGTNDTGHTNPIVAPDQFVSTGEVVSFGWYTQAERDDSPWELASDVLLLRGMENEFGSEVSDTYVLAMTYDDSMVSGSSDELLLRLVNYEDGDWRYAVDGNIGGAASFVLGAYDDQYGLGTYGLDLANQQVWAVLNHTDTEFAVALIPEPTGLLSLVAGSGLVLLARRRRPA